MVTESVEVAPNSVYTEGKMCLMDNLYVILRLTVIAGVCATDGGRVHARLPSHGEGVVAASSGGGGGKPRECLEVQPELADIGRGFVECVGTGGG